MIENLPYNDQAEKTVLGALLTGGDINVLIGDVGLQPSDFYIEPNRIVYTAALQLYEENKPIDFVTVNAKLQGNDAYGGVGYLKNIASNVPTVRHLKYYAEIVKEMSQRRNYIALATKLQNIAADCNKDIAGIDDVIEKVIMTENRDTGIISFGDAFIPVYQEIVSAYENRGKIPYQKTGFMSLDTALGGMKGLIVLGARPAMGKTMLGTNIAEHVAFQEDKPALIFSLEMPCEEIEKRIISSQSHTKHADLKFGTLTEDDFEAIGKLNAQYSSKLSIVPIPYININQIRSMSRRYKKQHGNLGVIIVDYIQLIDTGDDARGSTRANELGKISRGLKLLSKELDCPIIALSQLSRRVEERQDKRPTLSDLRESGAIEQDADTVMFIYRDEYYNKQSTKKGIAEVIIAKARDGETGTVELSFQPQIMKFMEKSDVERVRKARKQRANGT